LLEDLEFPELFFLLKFLSLESELILLLFGHSLEGFDFLLLFLGSLKLEILKLLSLLFDLFL
jgi:hypothetical protein